ncbi:EAL domain-containing protein [Thiohalobacter thiocyanaticus]|uniref:EAL domain-containing protein n=1 Tax=Thiohalobacter thiocyanaticus TaxID=585455 RepID=A0A426QGT5_9GAMM|nr:EAL domain-containing protein [Thiohalobacter thiocyanaticus]RRQ20964.1 EAL domain-containing protein [Thiohalobacter thiocyanaticus]
MNSPQNLTSPLSSKVTVIVFWGLVVIGLVFAGLFLHDKESATREWRELLSDSLAHRLEALQVGEDGLKPAKLNALFNPGQGIYPPLYFEAAEAGGLNVWIDQGTGSGGELQVHRRRLYLHNASGGADTTELRLHFPDLAAVVHQERSRLLLGLGVILLLLGVGLKLVLERMLTRPMTRMAESARAISAGDTSVSFDESRHDELGYLGGFVNEAIRRLIASENEARRSRELAEVTLHSIADAVVTTDEQGRITYMNPAARKLTGIAPGYGEQQPIGEVMRLAHEDDGTFIADPVSQCIDTNQVVDMQQHCVLIRRDGMPVPVDPAVAPIRDHDGRVRGAVMIMHDMSEARALQHELSYQASHDPLTGLYNRRELDHELQRLLERSTRDGHEHTLCYLDLDQFKVVNDTCGHAAGDLLLRNLTARLEGAMRKSDVLARLGGDEFGLLLYHCPLELALQTAEKVRTLVNEFRFVWEGRSFQIGVSIGLAPVQAGVSSAAEVLAAADMACYAAKEDGRNRIHVYRPDDEELHRRKEEMHMIAAVRRALEEDGLELFAQPILPVASGSELKRYEILVRMRDGQGGHIPPGAFLPALERYQLMAALDRWVVREAVDVLQTQLQAGRRLALSINLSGQSINEDAFLDFLSEQVARLEGESSLLCFEITETAVVNNLDRALRLIETLRAQGCKFALDDFGTGVSTFSYLKNLPVNYVKIDGAFISNILSSEVDQAMVRAIVDVARVIGMRTIAEFVESEAVHERLRELGVDYGQGYWYGRPGPVQTLFAPAGRAGGFDR